MAKISLDPQELKNQAFQMTSLGAEYETLFSGVNSILTNVNHNWSQNLSNNFSGKISAAQRSFSQVTEMLKFGADAANSSAESFESIDVQLSKFMGKYANSSSSGTVHGGGGHSFGEGSGGGGFRGVAEAVASSSIVKDITTNAYGAVTQSTRTKTNKAEDFWDACRGCAEAVVTKAKNAYSKAKKSYEEKGTWYYALESAKLLWKVGGAAVKIAGSVAGIASGVGIPIAICGLISAGNDLFNVFNDAYYLATNQLDEYGTKNLLKDCLVSGYGQLGELLGNREVGELVGELSYFGLDLVSFLNGAEKMLKSLGKVNTVVTDTTGYSKVWGWTHFDDIRDNQMKFDFKADYFIRKIMKVDPSSDLNIVYEGIKSVYSTLKKSLSIGEQIGNFWSYN